MHRHDNRGETRGCFQLVQGEGISERQGGAAPEFVTTVSTEDGVTEVRVYSHGTPRRLLAHVVAVAGESGRRATWAGLSHFGLAADTE